MFKITVPVDGKINQDSVERLLPHGYQADPCGFAGRFEILTSDGFEVGHASIMAEGIQISAEEGYDSGNAFWKAFSLVHPDLNPFTMLYGVVYQSGDGKFQLDEEPERLPQTAEEEAQHYTGTKAAFVEFRRGSWSEDSLTVLKYRPVLKSGGLGPDEGEKTLPLGNIENKDTM